MLIVRDVPQAATFYRDVVGLRPRTPESDWDQDWAWFDVGAPGGRQLLGLHRGALLFEEHSPRPAGARWGPVHFALNTPRDCLQESVEHVRAAGVEVFGPTRFDWMSAESYYFYDPDDNLVELWSPDDSP